MHRIVYFLLALTIVVLFIQGCNLNGTSPTVETVAITNVSSTSAISGGNITEDGDSDVTQRGVCWAITYNPTVNDNFTIDGAGTGNFTSSISNLQPNTTYYVRAYATNNSGTSYGLQISFTTLRCVQCLLQGQSLVFCENDYMNPSDYFAYINEIESAGGVCTP
jgi:hypothetical protein